MDAEVRATDDATFSCGVWQSTGRGVASIL
jgi:hypothetical protein